MAICIDKKRFFRELLKIEPVDGQLDEQSRKLRTLFLVLAGDKRVISDINMEGIAKLFCEAPEILSMYDSHTEDFFDESQLVDYTNTLRRAL